MKAILRMLLKKNVPINIAEKILWLTKVGVNRHRILTPVLADIQNLNIITKLSRHNYIFKRPEPSLKFQEKNIFLANENGLIQYHVRRIYDVTRCHPTVRSAILNKLYNNCDYGWSVQILRRKSIQDDFPKLLIIEIDEIFCEDEIYSPMSQYSVQPFDNE